MPNQKFGMLIPKKPTMDPRLSIHELGLPPAHTPERHRNDNGDHDREQRKLDRGRQPFGDHADHRIGEAERGAEIALQRGERNFQY